MNRKELKKSAKKCFKRNYLKTILVVFIIGLLVNGGYHFTTILSGSSGQQESKTNFQLVNDVVTKISKKASDGKSTGVIAPLFNKISENNSTVIGFLNSLNLFLLKY